MKNKVLFIVGPTASGKTQVSLQLADIHPIEFISADSRQIYRFMDIGTAKPEKSLLERYTHHFVNILNPDEYYSAGRFAKEARVVIADIFARKKIPVVVGGSGLYLKALIDGIFDADTKNEALRKNLEDRLIREGLAGLYRELQDKDPKYAEKISVNDRQRILRSLEVIHLTGKPFSEWHQTEGEQLPFDYKMIGLRIERDILYKRINQRVQDMLNMGLVNEVKVLLNKGYSLQHNALNTVGYKEVIQFLNDELSEQEMIELIKRNTRRYSKRQMTWFRADDRIQWCQIDSPENLEHLGAKLREILES